MREARAKILSLWRQLLAFVRPLGTILFLPFDQFRKLKVENARHKKWFFKPFATATTQFLFVFETTFYQKMHILTT